MTEPVYNNSSLSFSLELVGVTSLDRNSDSSFILPGLRLNTLETEKMLQFLGQKILDVYGKLNRGST